MNIEAIRKTRLAIQRAARPSSKPRVGFNMFNWITRTGHIDDKTGHDCRTVCCIAGWALIANGRGEPVVLERVWVEAREVLGLDWGEDEALFFARGANCLTQQITTAQAVKVLRLVEQGVKAYDAWNQATTEAPANA